MAFEIIPFEVEHLEAIQPRSFEGSELGSLEDWRERAKLYKRAGPAFTGVIDGQIMGSCGLIILWPGVAEGWMVSTNLVAKLPLTFHRAVTRGMDRLIKENGLRRIQVAIHADHKKSRNWITRLGFFYEGQMVSYGPDGSDYHRYGRTTKCLS